MAKKTPADWKKEADGLRATLAAAKKKPQNFGLVELNEGMCLMAHPIQPMEKLAAMAKKADGAKKANCVTGNLEVNGKIIVFNCQEEKLPGGMDVKFKQYLKLVEHGAWKAEFNLNGGSENGANGEAQADGEGPSREKLAADLKHMTEVFKLSFANMSEENAAQIKQALKGIAAAISGDDLTGAQNAMNKLTLLTGVSGESPLEAIAWGAAAPGTKGDGKAGGADGSDKNAKRKAELQKSFDELKPKLRDAVAAAEGAEKDRLGKLIKGFGKFLKDDKLEEAQKVLDALKEKLDEKKGVLDQLGDFVEDVKEKFEETIEDAKEELDEFVEDVKDVAQGVGDALGILNEEDQARKDKLEGIGVPEGRQMSLIKMARENPKTFDSAIKALEALKKKNGDVETGPEATTNAIKATQAAKAELQTARDAFNAAESAAFDADEALEAAQKAEEEAKKKAEEAQAALKKFQDSLPPLDKMNDKQREEMAKQSNALINAAEDAKKGLAAASAAVKAGEATLKAAEAVRDARTKVYNEKSDALKAQESKQQALEDKKNLLDALSFGPLSSGKMNDATVAKFVDAYAKDPQTANTAIEMAGKAEDPEMLAANVGMICDKVADGFADKNGKALGSPNEVREMAQNALAMGARMGPDYFKGFEEYLKSGKQHEPDPCEPDEWESDEQYDQKVAVARTGMMADALIGKNGKVDPDSPKAKAAMEHMLFHPGSLAEPSPQMVDQMSKMMDTFRDPEKGPRCQALLDGVKTAPVKGSNQSKMIAQATGKGADEKLSAGDTKSAILSAMMTPMSQGPVGSCFSTSVVRGVREQDPVAAMTSITEIAKTGMFTPAEGITFPAATEVPEGEHMLLRSWEYSAATAGAMHADSEWRDQLNGGLFGGNDLGKDLGGLKSIVGADKWRDEIEGKLRAAMKQGLAFSYNAAIAVDESGSGDGSSTDGHFELIRVSDGKKILTQEDFINTIVDLALKACGETKTSDIGKKIVEHVTAPAFIASVEKSYTWDQKDADGNVTFDDKPWNIASGGFSDTTTKAVKGGVHEFDEMTPEAGSGATVAARSKSILKGFLAGVPTDAGEMVNLSTSGPGAAHAFNALPNHPSLDKIKDPGSEQKINDELIQPGKDIAAKKLPLDQCVKLFDKQMTQIMNSWGDSEVEILTDALAKRPTEEMTPKELKDHIDAALADFKKEQARWRLEQWKEEQESDGKTVSPADLAKQKQELKDQVDGWCDEETKQIIRDVIEVPEVVIADTNWGGAKDQTLFVIAPDPISGELMMWRKEKFSGKMEPAGEEWTNASWSVLKDKTPPPPPPS